MPSPFQSASIRWRAGGSNSDTRRILERVRQSLDTAAADGDDVEAAHEPGALRVRREPRVGRSAQAALLLGRDHLERVAQPLPRLRLHLDEGEPPTAPHDEIELVAADPDVRAED